MKSLMTAAAAVWLCVASALFASTLAAPEEDRVAYLPNLEGNLDVRMYSGYLQPTREDHVHYLLVESDYKDSSEPLVLWLNGGPGASSLMGAFTELGPLIMSKEKDDRITLVRNPYAWNNVASMLFFESPTGVGFSYCDAMLENKQCQHNDTSTAELNLHSLMHFLEKFPEYQGRDFMIWGESYAGVYVPTLSELVYESDLKMNFLGFGVGDPCTDDKTQTFTGYLNFNFEFAYENSFLSTDNYNYIKRNCFKNNVPDTSTEECRSAWRMYFLATSGGDGNGTEVPVIPEGGFIDPYNSWGPNNNDFWELLNKYLGQDSVKEALHVDSYPGKWSLFANNLNYTKQYQACQDEPAMVPYYNYSMIEIYKKLAGNVRNIVVFNGDTDPSVQMRGTEAAVNSMGFETVEGADWRPWFFQPEETPIDLLEQKSPYWGTFLSYKALDTQMGGYVKNFEGNVSFVTVHDSGHMVPQYKPVAAFHLFVRGLNNKPLSPKLNMSTLTNSTDDDFFGHDGKEGYLGKWVAEAQGTDYTNNYEEKKQEHSEELPTKPNVLTARSFSRKDLRMSDKHQEAASASLKSLNLGQFSSLTKEEIKGVINELEKLYETKNN